MACSACKRLLRINPALFLLILLGNYAFANNKPPVDWQHEVKIITRAYQDLRSETPFEQEQAFEGRFLFENKITFPDQNILINLDLQTRYNAFLDGNTEKDAATTLRNAFVELTAGNQVFSAGKETITWGKLDDDSILDIINPEDYKLLFLIDKQERKIPEVMFRYDYNFDSSQVEAILMPVFQASKFRFFGNDWALFDHLKEATDASSAVPLAKSIVNNITTEDNRELYEENIENMQFGLRFRSRLKDIDYDLYYMNLYYRRPTLREKTPVGNLVKRFLYEPTTDNLASLVAAAPTTEDLSLISEHPRVHTIGLDMETIVGQCGLRGEAGVFLDEPYLRRDFSYVTKDTFSLGLAVDHMTGNNLYMKLGFREDVIFSYEDLFAQERYTHTLISSISKEFLRGKLICGVDAVYNFSLGDSMINPKITYKFNNGLDITVGTFVLEGDQASTYGRYDEKDLVYLEAVFKF